MRRRWADFRRSAGPAAREAELQRVELARQALCAAGLKRWAQVLALDGFDTPEEVGLAGAQRLLSVRGVGETGALEIRQLLRGLPEVEVARCPTCDGSGQAPPDVWDARRDAFLSSLTGRERQVLQLIVGGLSNRQIGDRLATSQQTVKNHVTSLLRKLDCEDRTQLAVRALRSGLVPLDRGKSECDG